MLTQHELKNELHYDQLTGLFTRLKSNTGSVKIGDIAGRDSSGYIKISVNGSDYLAHRLAWLYMTGCWPEKLIDHINGIRNDNKFENLRQANSSQNTVNTKPLKNNTSGHRGVFWRGDRNKWSARCVVNGKYQNLGCFAEKDDAIKAYIECAIKNHGEFVHSSITG